jgi:L-threonylcarbamoyladenylate synthase
MASISTPADLAARSPGQHPVHYAPTTPAYRFEANEARRVADWCGGHSDRRAAFVVLEPTARALAAALGKTQVVIPLPATPVEYARELYSQLRRADALGVDVLLIEVPPHDARWAAARDRVWRATRTLPDPQ